MRCCTVIKERARSFFTVKALKAFASQKVLGVKALQTYRPSLFGSDLLVRVKILYSQLDAAYTVTLEKVYLLDIIKSEPIPNGRSRHQQELIETSFNLLKSFKWKMRAEVVAVSLLFLIDTAEFVWLSEVERLEILKTDDRNLVEFILNLEVYKYKFATDCSESKRSEHPIRRHGPRNAQRQQLLTANKLRASYILFPTKKPVDKTFSLHAQQPCLAVSGEKMGLHSFIDPRSSVMPRPNTTVRQKSRTGLKSMGSYRVSTYEAPKRKIGRRPKTQGGSFMDFSREEEVKATSPERQVSIMLPSTRIIQQQQQHTRASSRNVNQIDFSSSESTMNPYGNVNSGDKKHRTQNAGYRRSSRMFSLTLAKILIELQEQHNKKVSHSSFISERNAGIGMARGSVNPKASRNALRLNGTIHRKVMNHKFSRKTISG